VTVYIATAAMSRVQIKAPRKKTHVATVGLKCNEMQGNAVPPPPIYGSKRSPTSDCYNARKKHAVIVRDPNPNVAFNRL